MTHDTHPGAMYPQHTADTPITTEQIRAAFDKATAHRVTTTPALPALTYHGLLAAVRHQTATKTIHGLTGITEDHIRQLADALPTRLLEALAVTIIETGLTLNDIADILTPHPQTATHHDTTTALAT